MLIDQVLLSFGVQHHRKGIESLYNPLELKPVGEVDGDGDAVLAGLVEMVVPSRREFRIRRFSRGIVVFSLGILLLLITIHMLSWQTIILMFEKLWPLLLIALGIDIISRAVGNELLALAAALCVVAMVVCAATVFAVPGSLEHLTVYSPLFGTHVFEVNPWN